jgi:hypothetical protein
MRRWIIFALAAAAGAVRLFITPRLTNIPTWELDYEAWVHLFVGGLIGVSWYNWHDKRATLYGRIGWVLAFWELGCFIVQKLHLGS